MPNRLVRTQEEIASIRRAAEIIDDTFDLILKELKAGVTEKQISDSISKHVLAAGAAGVSFETIVAFGESGAEPHHVPTEKKLESGMLVTIDMGAVYEGMCSDFTRTIAFGEVGDEQKKIYRIVLQAYKKAMSGVREGAQCRAVDAMARDYIESEGYGANYIHGTGHGVGELIHQPPTLNSKSDETLLGNEVITIEPGIYLEGRMGVRIEDMVVVGKNVPVSRHSVELKTVTAG